MILSLPSWLMLTLPLFVPQESGSPDGGERPREYWTQIVASGYALPEGDSAYELIVELSGYLSSRDSELRDNFAYGISAAWIYNQGLLSTDELLDLTASWSANLERGVGESGDDSVLLRSFSALNLSLLAAHDNRTPFLEAEDFDILLAGARTYLIEERDLRGWSEEAGWYHATAHTADLLKFLGRSGHLTPTGQSQILESIAQRMLATEGYVFVHGEEDRLASAIVSILLREDFDPQALTTLLERLAAGTRRSPDTVGFDPVQFAAQQNARNLLRALYVKFALAGELPPELVAAREQVLAALRAL